jgi:hypothetical protein
MLRNTKRLKSLQNNKSMKKNPIKMTVMIMMMNMGKKMMIKKKK